jgi:hypothetical protein
MYAMRSKALVRQCVVGKDLNRAKVNGLATSKHSKR